MFRRYIWQCSNIISKFVRLPTFDKRRRDYVAASVCDVNVSSSTRLTDRQVFDIQCQANVTGQWKISISCSGTAVGAHWQRAASETDPSQHLPHSVLYTETFSATNYTCTASLRRPDGHLQHVDKSRANNTPGDVALWSFGTLHNHMLRKSKMSLKSKWLVIRVLCTEKNRSVDMIK